MAAPRTCSALLLLTMTAAFTGCNAERSNFDTIIAGAGGNGGNGGKVFQLASTNQVGLANAAKTVQNANADGGSGGDGVAAGGDFPDSFAIFGQGGKGGNGGVVYQQSNTNQAGILNSASTTQTANANGGGGGDGVSGRKLLKKERDFPPFIALVGGGGRGGDGGTVVQYSKTNQFGAFNAATTTQMANANGGEGGAGINGRKMLVKMQPKSFYAFGFGGNGGKGGVIGQFQETNQLGIFNAATTSQDANANGGTGGDGIKG